MAAFHCDTYNQPMAASTRPILILGAGINGVALARELVLNRVPVVLVDSADLSSGATASSSRLIHGGLRYLEYFEFGLVRESLAERRRLLRLAPEFVRPLRVHIPIQNRSGGFWASFWRLLRGRASSKPSRRGLWLVRLGLWLYDRFARDPDLPPHSVQPLDASAPIPVDAEKFRWLCAYSDAQMIYPERFVLSMLEDARQLAHEAQVEFRLLTYHTARMHAAHVELRPTGDEQSAPVETLQPAAIINATGAWVDTTLRRLGISTDRLMGGTKGSHFVTSSPHLREALGGEAIYAEASDLRPVFLLPLGNNSLVGTTDIAFDGSPQDALASEDELSYLIDAVNHVLPQVELVRKDVMLHYSGVRPLPAARGARPRLDYTATSHPRAQERAATALVAGGRKTDHRPQPGRRGGRSNPD